MEIGWKLASSNFGLYRQADGKGGRCPTWLVRRDVPSDLRSRVRADGARFGRVLKATTGSTDSRVARVVAEGLWDRWGAEFAQARALGAGPLLTSEAAQAAIARWRARECASAGDMVLPPTLSADERWALDSVGAVRLDHARLLAMRRRERVAPLAATKWAQAYFDAHPEAVQTAEQPLHVAMRLEALWAAVATDAGWTRVEGFEAALDAAVVAGGGEGAWTPSVRDSVRQAYAQAALEVEQHRELQRRRAAVILATAAASQARADSIRADANVAAPRIGDKTVSEVITAFRKARPQGDTDKQYGHIFRALREVVGADQPIGALTRDDVRRVRTLLERMPSNASKVYPGMSLMEAAERGKVEGRPTMQPNTVRSYLVNLKAICNFAKAEGWLERKSVEGLTPSRQDAVQRRGFTRAELNAIFGSLHQERMLGAAKFWVPAIAAFSGARLNELCQLHVADVKVVDGHHYIDLTLYDVSGRRDDTKRLKTTPSPRAIPIHAEVLRAGFLDVVDARTSEGERRLFPELQSNEFGYHSHGFSKWFGRHLDLVGLSDPNLCFHSFRHGFRDAGSTVPLPDYIIDALGGWAAKGQATPQLHHAPRT